MGRTTALRHDAHRFGPAVPDEEYVFGSCAPGWHAAAGHETCVRAWIADMQSAGIERVCCLLAAEESEATGANLGSYREAFGADRVLHAPVPNHRLVHPELLASEILPFLDEARNSGEPVVVHGLAGLARTGQVLAAWLVYDRGYHPEDAVETVREMGRDPSDAIRYGNATEAELFELLGSVSG